MVEQAEYQPLPGSTRASSNYQEYFLQGSILDVNCTKLLDRLQDSWHTVKPLKRKRIIGGNIRKITNEIMFLLHLGLCDNVPKEPFADHERIYQIKNMNNTTVVAKACKALDKPDAPWQMKYVGTTEIGDRSKSSLIRSCVTVATSKDPSQFLEDLGFKLHNEFVMKGFFFRKGRIKTTVAKIHKLQEPGKLEAISSSHIVEVSVLAPAGQERAGDEVRQFCEHLKPIIVFDADHRKIQQLASN